MTKGEIINKIKSILEELSYEDAVSYLTLNDITWLEQNVKALEQEPKLEKDGTLIVTTEHYENVNRVLVQRGINGTLFYQDPCEDTHETVSRESYEHEYFLRKEFEVKIDKLQRQLEEQTAKAESILNNVRDKIADVADCDAYTDVQQAFNDGLWEAVKIIDKYKEGATRK